MKKYNLKDVTFLIQTRLDSIDRLINLRTTVKFIQKHFNTHIEIVEADRYNSQLIASVVKGITITFVEDYDPVFYRDIWTILS